MSEEKKNYRPVEIKDKVFKGFYVCGSRFVNNAKAAMREIGDYFDKSSTARKVATTAAVVAAGAIALTGEAGLPVLLGIAAVAINRKTPLMQKIVKDNSSRME